MMSTILLEIVTPERKVYGDQVNMVIARGTEGELGILPNHIPLVTPLEIAPLIIKQGNEEHRVAVSGGFMEVRKDKVVILAEAAELPEQIDVTRATAAKERAERRLNEGAKDDIDFKRAQLSLQRAVNRLEVAQKK
jgi:F-type H+-transporting ATPase subunit epsilon